MKKLFQRISSFHQILLLSFTLMGLSWMFPEIALADPFGAVAQKVTSTTKGILKIGAVACGLSGAILILQGVFGRLNFRWGISFFIAAILLASFDYVIDFVTH